jgi:uncharacterized membrane protein
MKGKWFGFLLILMALGFTCVFYRMLPDQVPIHWGINGMADRYQDKAVGAFLLPLIMLILLIFMRFLPKMDPNKENYVRFMKTYDLMINGILLFLFVLHVMALSFSLGWIQNTNYFVHLILGVFFIFVGNYMPKVKQNYFIGIRTPWTIANVEVWKKTHRFGGRVFVTTGFLFIGIIFLPTAVQSIVTIILLCASLTIIFISSYFFFVKG